MKLCFWCLFIVFCACYFLLLPKPFPVFFEEDRRCFAYRKQSFLTSVPRCCSVITDILKQQKKKIIFGEGKDFCWGISADCSSFWGWMVGRIWQQEEKWFLRNDSVWGCFWPGFGMCPNTKERPFMALFWMWDVGQSSPCCCWKLPGPEGAISGWNRAGIWSGLHRQASLVHRDWSLPLLPLWAPLRSRNVRVELGIKCI